MKIERFEDLLIWQRSKELTVEIYYIFENSKNFGFKDQINRAVVSVMNNMQKDLKEKAIKSLNYFYIMQKEVQVKFVICYIWQKNLNT